MDIEIPMSDGGCTPFLTPRSPNLDAKLIHFPRGIGGSFRPHVPADHAALLKFVRTTFNLPALSRRDTNAADLSALFDALTPDAREPEWATVAAPEAR